MRAWLGTWGADCSDEERACAFAAAGVLTAGSLSKPEALRLEDGANQWGWPDLAAMADVKALAKSWTQVRAGRAIRLRMHAFNRPERGATIEAQAWLGRPQVVGDGAVSIAMYLMHDRPAWRWPLDVAVVSDKAADQLADDLGQAYFVGRGLATVRRLGTPHWRTTLLILDGSLIESAAAILALHRSVRASIVVVLGRQASTVDRTIASINLILDITHAHAMVVGAGDPASGGRSFLDGLIKHLANDNPLDVALVQASDAGALVLASDDIIDAIRLSKRLVSVAKNLSELTDTFPSGLSGLDSIGGMPIKAKNGGLEVNIKKAMPPQAWEHESEAATGLSQAEDLMDHEAANAPPRWLQAQLSDDGKQVKAVRREHTYSIRVMVGPKDPNFRALERPVEGLPDSDTAEPLMVVMTDPVLAPTPVVEWITLPPAGKSTLATFTLTTTAETDQIEARITILHDGRVLQTGVVLAPCDGETEWTFTADAIARAHLAGLHDRRHFGAALIANHTTKGAPGFLAADAHGKAVRLALGENDIQAMVTALGVGFDELKDDPDPDRSLRAKSSITALRTLAQHGAMFHQSLVNDNAIAPSLLTTDPIQIVSARPNSFFPLELAYRYPAPDDDAALCKHAEEALEQGHCNKSCKPGAKKLCPLGFWSLSRVIERCAYRPTDPKLDADFGLSIEPLRDRSALAKPARAALAASDIAKKRVPTAISDLRAALAKVFGGEAPVAASSWDAWKKSLATDPWPALLVVVAHHDQENSFEFLEIGADSRLKAPQLAEPYVIGTRKKETAQRPIVMLAGCETAVSNISFEGFVPRFQMFGAAVVLGTIASVLGLDAAPVAGELAEELFGAFGKAPPRTIGEAMLRARQRLVAKGRVMVLSLAAYGDADWQLA